MNEVEFPTITVGDRALTVRFSICTQVLLNRYGLDPRKLTEALAPNNPQATENMMIFFCCCVAENYIDTSNPDKCELVGYPSPAYWTMNIHPLQYDEIVRAVSDAAGKVTEARKKTLLAAAPPQSISLAS